MKSHQILVVAIVMICCMGRAMQDSERGDASRWQRQIDEVGAAGGGRVVVPAGDWETCPLRLGSNVELHLEAGARLLASTSRSGYATLPVGYSEGALFGVVSAMGVTNVSITGCGEIVGRGEMWPQPGEYGGNQEGGRPRGIVFAACRDVRLADFTLRDSPCWGIVLKNCDGVIARRVKIDSHCNANNDGFDIEARNVRIEDCDVDTGGRCVLPQVERSRLRDDECRDPQLRRTLELQCLQDRDGEPWHGSPYPFRELPDRSAAAEFPFACHGAGNAEGGNRLVLLQPDAGMGWRTGASRRNVRCRRRMCGWRRGLGCGLRGS